MIDSDSTNTNIESNLPNSENTSSYPPSVQPGIPKLPQTPIGWMQVPLAKHLHEIRRPVRLQDDTEYTLVTVKRSRGGVTKREVLRGSEVKTQSQFYVRAGDFLISKRQIVHGACGIVPPELDGSIVSNEYVVLGTDGGIDLKFLKYLSETKYFQQTCFHSSVGVHVEKMVFRTGKWLSWFFNIPSVEIQQYLCKLLETWDSSIVIEDQLAGLGNLEKRSLVQRLIPNLTGVKVPSGWEAFHLSALVDINPSRPQPPVDGRVSFVPMKAVSAEGHLLKLQDCNYSEVSTGFTSFCDGDVLVAKITPCFENGKGALVSELTNGIGFGSTEFHVLRTKHGVPGELIAQVTRSPQFRMRGATEMVGSAGQRRVSADFIKSFRFFCPKESKKRDAIAIALKTSDTLLRLRRASGRALKQQRLMLIDDLCTGRKTVSQLNGRRL